MFWALKHTYDLLRPVGQGKDQFHMCNVSRHSLFTQQTQRRYGGIGCLYVQVLKAHTYTEKNKDTETKIDREGEENQPHTSRTES